MLERCKFSRKAVELCYGCDSCCSFCIRLCMYAIKGEEVFVCSSKS